MMYKPNYTGETVHIACGSQVRYYFRIMLSEVRQTIFEIKKRNHIFHIKNYIPNNFLVSPTFPCCGDSLSLNSVFSLRRGHPELGVLVVSGEITYHLDLGFALENSFFCKDLFTLFAFFLYNKFNAQICRF